MIGIKHLIRQQIISMQIIITFSRKNLLQSLSKEISFLLRGRNLLSRYNLTGLTTYSPLVLNCRRLKCVERKEKNFLPEIFGLDRSERRGERS